MNTTQKVLQKVVDDLRGITTQIEKISDEFNSSKNRSGLMLNRLDIAMDSIKDAIDELKAAIR